MQLRTGLGVVVLAAALLGAAVVATPASGQTGFVAQQTGVDADDVRITVALHENGTAEWTLAFRSVLDTDDREAAFESVQADIADDPAAYTDPFAERIRRSVAAAENATDREMRATSFSVATEQQSLGREYGIVTYSFTWQNFAATADGELRAGDAIDGFFLDDQTRLRMQWPAGYTADAVTPTADETPENAVVWDGARTDFVSGEPRVVVAPGGGGLGLGWTAAVVVILLMAGVGGWILRRRNADDATPTVSVETAASETTTDADVADAAESDDATDTAASADESTAEPESVDADVSGAEAVDDADSAAADSADPTTDDDAATDESVDPELLSNEERVLRLLDDNGGRMKQKQVVEELGWTDAKTSKVVSGLREDGTIESFRIGRENVLTYPDEGLTDE